MTLSHNYQADKEAPHCNQLVKITYSKPVLYMNILEKFWAKTLKPNQTNYLPNSNESSQNSSELNYKQNSQLMPNAFMNLQQSNQHSFNELIISMLVKWGYFHKDFIIYHRCKIIKKDKKNNQFLIYQSWIKTQLINAKPLPPLSFIFTRSYLLSFMFSKNCIFLSHAFSFISSLLISNFFIASIPNSLPF